MYLYILTIQPPESKPEEYIVRYDQRDIKFLKQDLAKGGEKIGRVITIPLADFGEHAHMLWSIIEVGRDDSDAYVDVQNFLRRNLPHKRRGVQMTVIGAERILTGPPKALWRSWRQFPQQNEAQDRLLFQLMSVLAEHMRR